MSRRQYARSLRPLSIGIGLLAAAACGESREPPATGDPPEEAAPLTLPAPEPEEPLFPPEVGSLELKRSITVRWEPHGDAKKLGTVAAHTRVAWKGAASGAGCPSRWIEIEPLGWVCEEYLRPTPHPPRGVEMPKLGEGELVPGTYGKVIARGSMVYRQASGMMVPARRLSGAVTVRRYGELTVRGARYWAIGGGEYLPEKSLVVHEPSSWQGVRPGEGSPALPLGFATGRSPHAPPRVRSYRDSTLRGAPVRTLAPREVVPVLESAAGADGRATAYRIGEEEWVAAADLRIARASDRPASAVAGERWVDVDLDEQTLVAYEGDEPILATLISSGARATPTQTGVYRVWLKFAETDMSGQMGEAAEYSVATVPWTQFYARDLALHTAYWHDRFGFPRSHGCVNLAPLDARFLYFWTAPEVPLGWSMANGIVERPGSTVRVRSAADPDPELRGYARRVDQRAMLLWRPWSSSSRWNTPASAARSATSS